MLSAQHLARRAIRPVLIRSRMFSRARMAFDAAVEGQEQSFESALEVLLRLKKKMSPEGFETLLDAIKDYSAEDDNFLDKELSPLDEQKDRDAMDEPPDFTGKPKTGGGKATGFAADGKAMSSFAKMHPDAARIGINGVANSSRAHQRPAPSADATRRFAEMYPGAGDIKI